MTQYKAHGATVDIDSGQLVINRNVVTAMAAGGTQTISLSEIVAIHTKAPTLFGNGFIQLCVGELRDRLGRGAPSDPHTVLFTRRQRPQMRELCGYLEQLAEHNRNHRPAGTRAHSRPAGAVATSTPVTGATTPEVPARSPAGPSFVGFDVETANSDRGSICAIGLTVVRGGRIVDTRSWLCQPPERLDSFEPRNIDIHGIRPEDVSAQPTFGERFADVLDLVGELPLVAHNASFDIGAIRAASAATELSWRPLRYGCTLQWSRRDLPGLANYRLPTVSAALGVDLLQHHDASADAAAAANIALELMRRSDAASVDAYAANVGMRLGKATVESKTAPGDVQGPSRDTRPVTRANDTTPPKPAADADPTDPLCGQTVVVTGRLSGITRAEVWELLAKHGAHVHKSVTRTTSILVVGGRSGDDPAPADTEKVQNARHLHDAGQELVLLKQQELQRLLDGDRSVTVPDLSAAESIDAYALADDSAIAPDDRDDPGQQVRGRHYSAWIEPVKQLKRDNRLDEALALLLECVDVAEHTHLRNGEPPSAWWTKQAAIVYRKQRDHDGEITIVQRWVDATERAGHTVPEMDELRQRIHKARTLREKHRQH